ERQMQAKLHAHPLDHMGRSTIADDRQRRIDGNDAADEESDRKQAKKGGDDGQQEAEDRQAATPGAASAAPGFRTVVGDGQGFVPISPWRRYGRNWYRSSGRACSSSTCPNSPQPRSAGRR